jgi:hypothetical protein
MTKDSRQWSRLVVGVARVAEIAVTYAGIEQADEALRDETESAG